jgi:hypothetical protein
MLPWQHVEIRPYQTMDMTLNRHVASPTSVKHLKPTHFIITPLTQPLLKQRQTPKTYNKRQKLLDGPTQAADTGPAPPGHNPRILLSDPKRLRVLVRLPVGVHLSEFEELFDALVQCLPPDCMEPIDGTYHLAPGLTAWILVIHMTKTPKNRNLALSYITNTLPARTSNAYWHINSSSDLPVKRRLVRCVRTKPRGKIIS